MSDGEMNMGESCVPGKADQAQDLTAFNNVAGFHPQGSFPQVTILGFPAIIMDDKQAVSALAMQNSGPVIFGVYESVGHAVTHSLHPAGDKNG
jgi:hypothetical protein